MKKFIVNWIMFSCLFGIMFFCGYMIGVTHGEQGVDIFSKIKYKNNNTNISINDLCGNLEFPDDLKCIQNDINQWYSYTFTDDNKTLSIGDLKEKGGDCLNYARYWKKQGELLNYSTTISVFDIKDKPERHAVTILSSHKGYCIADQQSLKCTEYVNE